MRLLEGKSKREKILIIGLMVSLIFSVYLITRVGALTEDIAKLEENYKSETKKLNRLNKATGNAKPSEQVIKQVKSLEKKLDIERQSLEGFEFKFVDLSNKEALLEQITQITVAAENNKLRILSKQNELRPLTSMIGNVIQNLSPANPTNNKVKKRSKNLQQSNLLNNNIASDKLQRRMYRLKLRGTFKSTYDFIKELQKLDYGVLITKLSMTADDKNTYNGLRLVIADITLAI